MTSQRQLELRGLKQQRRRPVSPTSAVADTIDVVGINGIVIVSQHAVGRLSAPRSSKHTRVQILTTQYLISLTG